MPAPPDISNVTIRRTEVADLPSLIACLNPVFEERRFLAIIEALPPDEVIKHHRATLEAGHPHFVAMDGDRVVGLCDVVPVAPPRIAAQMHNGTLGMLLVPEYRGAGLGERLMRASLAACRGKFERVQLSVYSHNERAHRLYLRCGFIEEGRRRGAWKLDGMTSDIIEMALFV